ncbi:MAG: AI-2E family transporter, partial [Firmicutes bacterium]|nr:AI-2E family transporter [Bacillota bacterium]
MGDKQLALAFKMALAFAVVAGLVLFLARMLWLFNLIIIAFLIVYSISPGVDYLTRCKGMSRLGAVTIVYVSFLLFLFLLLYLIIPIIVTELRDLALHLPQYSPYLEPYLKSIGETLSRPEVVDFILDFLQQLPRTLQQILNQVTNFTVAVVSRLSEIAVVLFMVFYLLRDSEGIKDSLVHYLPRPWRKEAVHVLGVIDAKVGAYLRGNVARCTLVGIATGLGLYFIGMPFALMLGVLAGVLNLIVYIGPYLAAAPAILIALSQSLQLAIIVAILYIVVQTADAFLLTPLLLGKAVDIHPFSVIIAILIGGRLLGILGILLAIPMAATLKVLFNYYYLRKL